MSMTFNTALDLPVENGWATEIGWLCELHRLVDPSKICQVDLAIQYDHKHQTIDIAQPQVGLLRMASDIAISMLTHIEREGALLDQNALDYILGAFEKISNDFVRRYQHVARLNAIPFDESQEIATAQAFHSILAKACWTFVNGTRSKNLPPWRLLQKSGWQPDFHIITDMGD
jgi:glucosyl-3-phosphoglycerate synthase